jgi:putative tricarboxylic transport membrane protein
VGLSPGTNGWSGSSDTWRAPCSTVTHASGRVGAMRRVPGGALVHVAAAAVLLLATTSCGVTRGEDSRDLLMIIPNSPGGGYDQTGRAAVKVMEAGDITGGSFTVDNVIGAGGAGAMTTLIGKAGDEHTMMTVGLGVVGSTYSFGSKYQLQDATPLAQLMSEPEGILVPAESPFETLDDLVQAWEEDPGSIAVGGGSSPGGPDHLFPMQLADEIGVDPNDVNYVSYDGGGPLTSALLGEKIDVGFSGLAEFVGDVESGKLRVLAVSGEERYPDGPFTEIPTLTESDVDLVFLNWRGVLAPPEISDERTDELIGYLQEMHDSQGWKDQLAKNGWTDDFKTGDDFAEFIDEQDERVSGTLKELGLL